MPEQRYGGSPQALTDHLREHLDKANDAARVGDIKAYVFQLSIVHGECVDIMRNCGALVQELGMNAASAEFMSTALEYDDERGVR